jgi:hypothetical protein
MDIEQRILAIEARNRRVEKDKAWETSWARKALIALFTYLTLALYMNAIDTVRPWHNAIVPTVGFMLSALSLPLFKRIWLTWRNRRGDAD